MAIPCVYKPKTHTGPDPSRRRGTNLIDRRRGEQPEEAAISARRA